MLTRKQHDLLIFIADRLGEDGVPPSFDEMKDALGLKSKSGIHRLITGLEERGFIRRLPHRARALEVLRLPEDRTPAAPAPVAVPETDNSNVIRGNFGTPRGIDGDRAQEAVSLPLYGKIAAGTPIAALQDPSRFVDVPPSMLGGGDHYALEIEGDSMIEAGIFDGDTVIIEPCSRAENGTIVVALVDDEEATLKRIRVRGQSVALEPANPDYETRICGPDQVKVQGRLVGLIRQY